FRKFIEVPKVTDLQLTAKRAFLLRQCDITSPPVKKGEIVSATIIDAGYLVSKNGQSEVYTKDQASKLFSFPVAVGTETSTDDQYQWKLLHEGKNKAFPDIYKQNLSIIAKSGVDFLWPPQVDSLSELMMSPGSVAGWEQGCGKARLAVSLCLTSTSKHNLIAVEGGLVEEMEIELKKLGISNYQVI